jgi:hypothetical protein
LSILAAPVAILLSDVSYFSEGDKRSRRHFVNMMLVFILSTAYSTTLFSYTHKPLTLASNFPALIIMLLITTCFSVISGTKLNREASETEETA